MLQSCFQRAYLGFVAFLTLFLLFFLCPVLSLLKKFQRSISRGTCLFCLSLSAMKNALTKKEKKAKRNPTKPSTKEATKKRNQIISRKGREIIVQPRVLAAKMCENESWRKGSERVRANILSARTFSAARETFAQKHTEKVSDTHILFGRVSKLLHVTAMIYTLWYLGFKLPELKFLK